MYTAMVMLAIAFLGVGDEAPPCVVTVVAFGDDELPVPYTAAKLRLADDYREVWSGRADESGRLSGPGALALAGDPGRSPESPAWGL